MKRHSFGRALGFAAVAAALTFPMLVLGAAVWGYEGSLALYMLALAPMCTFSAAPDLRSGLRGCALPLLLAILLWAVIDSVQAALLGTLVALAVGRGLSSPPRAFGRVLFVELLLGALSFAAFAAFRDGHLIGDAIAVWAFWLTQSVFALIAYKQTRPDDEPLDRFVAARAAAERLLQL